MISGGLCPYENGSQLAEAAEFLHAHQQFVSLVTIDLGANDIESCGSLSTGIDIVCVQQAFQAVMASLPYIVGVLRAAAGPGVPIVAMNYYNPFLAAWLSPNPLDQALALQSQPVLGLFNVVLGGIYGAFLVPVADVAGAFHANDNLMVDPTPAFLVCAWTWMCTPPGPNIHPNAIGYGVIAQAFLAVLPALP
jgi:lysophospholipase L1-like esterase